MKNEIGRKLTSLTIMAIMFAGGMTIGVPSLMPSAASDFSLTDGQLTVSSEFIQGAAVLEIVVNDPSIADTENEINNGAEATIMGDDYIMSQAANGKWYLYVVDESTATLMDADANGLEYGELCTAGMGTDGTANVIPNGSDGDGVWAASYDVGTDPGECLDIDGMLSNYDTATTTKRHDLTAVVLTDAPSLSNHNDANTDLGQRLHVLNATSGYGTWPYILGLELASDTVIEYGDYSVTVEYGNTDDEAAIALVNQNPAGNHEIHLSITDPALNIDPTGEDAWIFDLNQESTFRLGTNGTNNTISIAEAGEMGCDENCYLTVDDASTAPSSLLGYDDVLMSESGSNTGVFESWDDEGHSELATIDQAAGDTQHTFHYGGEDIDMVITYNDATMDFGSGITAWEPTQVATLVINDPDANLNPGDADDLEIGNATHVIPTIVMGSPLTLSGGANPNLEAADARNAAGVSIGSKGGTGEDMYNFQINNTTDNSQRLKVTATTGWSHGSAQTTTWINVTTGHTRDTLMNLPGTVVLNYDVSGPAGILETTAIAVYVQDDGNNGSDHTSGIIDALTSGNQDAGVIDLDDGTHFLRSPDISSQDTWGKNPHPGTNFVSVNFKLTHASGNSLAEEGAAQGSEFAIAADFCNFDQNNGSDIHNCIYRLEAEETGDNTGIFEGTVEYVMLNNSTAGGSTSGEHDGNDHEVEGLLTTNSDELTVVIMDGVDGTDSVRVLYNDTDALQQEEKLGAQLDGFTHTGSASLDAGSYEADDMATITIVDPDLNQDSSIRDVYQNSSTTFQMTISKSDGTAQKPFATSPMSVIETTPTSGIFVGTFKVPDYKGSDMELTYYESKDVGGNNVEFYDTAEITSNTGSVSFDKSVYPVPFAAGDLREGDDGTSGQDEAGNVTITIIVEDADMTDDTLTTTTKSTAGSILVKLIEGSTTSTCFSAGSQVAFDNTAGGGGTANIQELGPLTEVERDSSVFEVEFTLDEVMHCGTMQTVTSGDVLQVEYVDTADDGGVTSTVYDSSTFDLRTGSLSVDKDVYVLGSDLVLTLTDPDLNLDPGSVESYAMSLIEWDSDADSSQLLDNETISSATTANSFTVNPSSLQETGDDTGVFQTVVTLPTANIGTSSIDFGEAVTLTYVDVGLSGEDSTEDDTLDVEAYFSISNFGALVELDKAVYNWTDTVYITITAPDHNNNTAGEEQIGTSSLPIQVTTRQGKLCTTGDKTYVADESDEDTGVFEAEVALVGFDHTMSSDDSYTASTSGTSCTTNDGGIMKTASQTDGISVSYEYNDGSVVVASASIVWNIGEASFDSSAVSAGGSALLTVVDPDENLDGDIVDTFEVDVFSDSDNGGFQLTMNETDEDTGVFEGTVYFTSDLATSGSNLRVSEGDTVTAEYTDETLPEPYTTDDDLTIAATTTVGTAFPPLERAPAANARVVDAFGASVAEVTVDQQVQIAADVSNGQSKDQAFAYLVQVQDGNGVTVSLAWITGSLTAGQSMSPALSWTPDASGSYTATVFVWESVDNPTALSPTVSVDIDVV